MAYGVKWRNGESWRSVNGGSVMAKALYKIMYGINENVIMASKWRNMASAESEIMAKNENGGSEMK
jgi:hypothetical protein